MGYKSINPATKLDVVKYYYSCSNISETSTKFGISRNAVYEWSRFADEVLLRGFAEKTPGKRTATPEEEATILRKQLKELLDVHHKFSQDAQRPSPAVVCSQCGSTELCRNGKVLTKRHGIRQRWLCRRCAVSIYVDVKKTP